MDVSYYVATTCVGLSTDVSMETSAFEPLYDGRLTFPYQLETEKNVEK